MKEFFALIVLGFVWLVRIAIYIGIAYVIFAFLATLVTGSFAFE